MIDIVYMKWTNMERSTCFYHDHFICFCRVLTQNLIFVFLDKSWYDLAIFEKRMNVGVTEKLWWHDLENNHGTNSHVRCSCLCMNWSRGAIRANCTAICLELNVVVDPFVDRVW